MCPVSGTMPKERRKSTNMRKKSRAKKVAQQVPVEDDSDVARNTFG